MGSRDLPDDYTRATALVDALFAEFMRPPANLTVSQWADKNRMLSGKASSEPGPWRTDRTPYLRQIMDDLSARSTVQEVVVMFGAQLGKALALDTPVPTPAGWTTMSAIRIGDLVFDENGKPCTVVDKSPIYVGHTCYRVKFSDGSEIVADAGHRWTVDDERDYRKKASVTITTETIASTFKNGKRHRYAIPVAGALQCEDADLPISPYTFGAWLGDGNSASANITQHIDDADHMKGIVEGDGYHVKVKYHSGNAVTLGIDGHGIRDGVCSRGHLLAETGSFTTKGRAPKCSECHRQRAMKYLSGHAMEPILRTSFQSKLSALGVLKNKHIPLQYLRASEQQRMALLRGLMDTDGYVDASGSHVEIQSSYPSLAAGIVELVRSLGFKPHVKTKKTACKDATRITWTAYSEKNVFSMPRKAARLRPMAGGRTSETSRRRIIGVDLMDSVPVCCISVDSSAHLFLAGAEMIPTHNSESGNNWLGYIIDNEPGPVMIVQPTTDMAKRFSRQRITPMLEETPALRRKVRENRSRDDANTTLMKDFAGGVLVVSGANSAAGLRSMPVRYLFLDEIDAYPLDVDGEGDPVALAEKRTSTFARKKVLKVSTPTIKDFSRIESAFDQSTAARYQVACPHCGEHQVLEWGTSKPYGLRWDRDDQGSPLLGTVRYVCQHHGCEIQEHEKPAMLATGRWVSSKESSRPGKLTGYHLNALYAPLGWVSWADLVQQFTEAAQAAKQGDISKLKTFTNTVLAETWEEQGDKIATHELARRAEDYALTTVPWGGLVITAGVDTQGDRLEAYAYAVGRQNERWLVDHKVIYGDPSLPEDQPGSPWEALTQWRRTPFTHASGATLPLSACAVDSGGHHTQQVYHYARRHQAEHVLAIKGSSQANKPVLGKPSDVEVNYKGNRIKRGARVWPVGTDTAKSIIYSELRVLQVGPGYRHFSRHTPSYVYDQLTAERLVTRYHKGRPKLEWLKPTGRRNEALDCTVYSLVCEHYLGVPKYANHHWEKIESRLRQRDMLEAESTPLQIDTQKATIVPVAVSENPISLQADNEPPQSPDADPVLSQAVVPAEIPKHQAAARPSRLPVLPRKGGWIKKW